MDRPTLPLPLLSLLFAACHGPALRQPVGSTPTARVARPAPTASAPAGHAAAPPLQAPLRRAPPAPLPSPPVPLPSPPVPPLEPSMTNATCDLPDTAEEAPLFASHEAALRKRGTQILDGIVACFEAGLYRGRRLVLTGYADPRGSAEYNYELALARARAVRRYLIRRGVPAERIEIASAGEAVYRGTGPESWMYDRRVEITSRPAPLSQEQAGAASPLQRGAPIPPRRGP